MATIKSFTSLEQSKKLAEILPIESADNHYWRNGYNNYICGLGNSVELKEKFEEKGIKYLPCWSLAALLSVLNFPSLTKNKEDEWEVCVPNYQSDGYIEVLASNPVDACYEMILKLKEQNLL